MRDARARVHEVTLTLIHIAKLFSNEFILWCVLRKNILSMVCLNKGKYGVLFVPLVSHPIVRTYCTVWRPLSCDVLFCFPSLVPDTNWAAHYLQNQPTGRWNMSKMLHKLSRLSRCHTVYVIGLFIG